MFRSVRIQNFRQFKDLELKSLGRINLITGQNNTGKTSLLEALILLLSPTNPEIVLTVARQRGIDTVQAEGSNAWGWIFNDLVASEVITIESVDDTANTTKLQIKSSRGLRLPTAKPRPGTRPPGTSEPVLTTSGLPLPSLVFEYEDSWGQHGMSRIRLDDDGSSIEHAAGRINDRPSFFLANRPPRSSFDAQTYSRVVQANQEREVLDALRLIDPRLRRLQILDTGTGANVYADFGDGNLLPLNVAGQGFGRALTLVSSIIEMATGVVLIDEIEDGLHYSVLPAVWKAIITAAQTHDVQLFATTHSYECIQAAVAASSDLDDGLAMFRLARVDGRIRIVDVDDEGLRDAVSLGFEMR